MPTLPCLLLLFAVISWPARAVQLKAGSCAVDISPTDFPVRVNAMFTERSADKVSDRLFAKALALDDGSTRIVICVVDSCMVPRELIDRAKAAASKMCGVPLERMLVSSTHTHSAPSAMGCLGSRVDPGYAAFLPEKIAQAIAGAVKRLAPARIGWAQADDWEHTFNRRWIRRPDRMLTDPFGERNVRANMHPGHESPDAIGPSGPVDPQLSVLAAQYLDGKPLAMLANYSQHYYGSPLLSSDYYGRFARHVATLLGADDAFVGIMSQGTSGDLMWMDYSAPKREIGYDAYAKEIAERACRMIRGIAWMDSLPLAMAERTLELKYREPDEKRLAWAQEIAARLGGKLPQTQPEIYALEALYLHEKPRTELKVQAVRIGELGIAALPNEVFAISGLNLKRHSPFLNTFNIELANGAEGYIPPPEQHRLGGYTTWAARTAGLESNAEPRIVETALALLETVAERPRRDGRTQAGPYVRAVLNSRPLAYWRCEEMCGHVAIDAMGQHRGVYEDGIAFYLPGADARIGHQPPEPATPNAFSGAMINRAVHLAGGKLRAELPLGDRYSVELWFWNGLPTTNRAVTGVLFSKGASRASDDFSGERLSIGGTNHPDWTGRLVLDNSSDIGTPLAGKTDLTLQTWHHVTLVRNGPNFQVYLNGQSMPEISGELEVSQGHAFNTVMIGGSTDNRNNLEGKIDEISVYPRALLANDITAHYRAAAIDRVVRTVPEKTGSVR